MNTQNNILLLWEDDDDFIKMFSSFLQEYGHLMNSVKSFEECVKVCKNESPTLLIVRSFVNEPRDGLEFIRKLRPDSTISYFPIIVGWADITHDEAKEGFQEAFEAGANAYFGRVFDIADVLKEIELLLKDPMATGIIDRQTERFQNRVNRKS
jgi:DNA-binding response OmpR family regulator